MIHLDQRIGSLLASGQGLFYLATGIWPLISAGSFQKVTGPKVDVWLVKTVGLLVGLIGGVLAWAGFRREVGVDLGVLAAGSAAALATVDIVYTSKKRISPVYLLDAVVELGLVAGWLVALLQHKRLPGK